MNEKNIPDSPESADRGSSLARCYASRPVTPERHRAYVQRFITEATPYTRAMCELEMLMPSTYVQQPDGSLQKTHDLWPQWAKDHWKILNEICEEIKERAAREA